MKHGHIPALVAMLLIGNGCSWYRSMERSLVDDEAKQRKKSQMVTREQYDQLLVKYEDLAKKYEELKEKTPPKSSLVDELQGTRVETETVDVFASSGNENFSASTFKGVPTDLESQLTLYRRAVGIKATNPGEATKILQELESHAHPSIQARSKLQIGEMLLSKGQHDLALQVFEDIIHRHAHSGIVLDALKLAIVSSDKLGLQNKKEQYASMLNDVFEAN